MSSQFPNLSDSNLRRRSFRGQNLEGADFRGADLRGSDFSQANLSGANFARARLGLCPRAGLISGVILLVSGAFGLDSVSQMIFGVLGMTTDDPNYLVRFILVLCLGMAGGLVAIAPRLTARRILIAIAALFEGFLLGSYWGGLLLERTLFHVCLGAGLASIPLMAGVLLWERRGFGLVVMTLGVTFANGMFFLSGVNALQAWAVQSRMYALAWTSITVIYFGVTILSLLALYQQFKSVTSTNFSGANLSQVSWQD